MHDDDAPAAPPASPTSEATALRSLRLAATLAHGLPGARLVVSAETADGRRVSRDTGAVSACQLRLAVAAARTEGALGPVRELLGLPDSVIPSCSLTVDDPSVLDLRGGVYAIRAGDVMGLISATVLSPQDARRVASERIGCGSQGCEAAPPSSPQQPLRIGLDTATGVSVVLGQTAIDDPDASGYVAGVRAVAAACMVEELVAAR